jgi:hypothetical protein
MSDQLPTRVELRSTLRHYVEMTIYLGFVLGVYYLWTSSVAGLIAGLVIYFAVIAFAFMLRLTADDRGIRLTVPRQDFLWEDIKSFTARKGIWPRWGAPYSSMSFSLTDGKRNLIPLGTFDRGEVEVFLVLVQRHIAKASSGDV